MLVNTREFQRVAQYHTKYSRYTDIPPDHIEYKEFWDNEIEKCLHGVKIGDTYITGYHYFYLNFCKIMRTEDTYGTVHNSKEKYVITEKDDFFPAFWDGDHQYFNVVERCENPHNPLIDIRGLNVLNDGNRKHLIVLKARGKGYSFKGGAMMARNYYLIRKSKSYAIASENEFLTKDGILTKAWSYLDFIDQNTAWRKRRLKNAPMHKTAGYKNTINGVESDAGYMSHIIGVTLKNDVQKARGKRGKLIVWEEAGKFPGFKRAWNIARPSVEDRDIVTGFMIGQGTGGTEGANFEDVEEMFYNPNAYNAVCVENFWDEGGLGTSCGLFIPDYINAGSFMDDDGNSHHAEAKAFEENQREIIAANATSPTEVDEHAAEHPFTPREACLQTSGNIFPKLLLQSQLNAVRTNRNLNAGVPIDLEYYFNDKLGREDVRITDNPDIIEKLSPILKFPTSKDAGEGCIIMYEAPFTRGGGVPDDLYYIANDPFAQSGGQSLGSCAVYKRVNKWSSPDDIIVAEYHARPASTEEYDRRMFKLAEFYNAKIGFENDRGDVLSNAKLMKKVHLLEPQFTLEYNNDLKDSPVARPYGMHMTESRKVAGAGYLNTWLRRLRGYDTNGKAILNLNMIRDPATLEELIAFNYKGNFDRVSQMIIAMFYEKEMDFTERSIGEQEREDDFFNRRRFFGGDEDMNGQWAASDEINIYDNYTGGHTLMY